MSVAQSWTGVKTAVAVSTRVFIADVGHGLLAVSHSSLALLGLGVLSASLLVSGRADLRGSLEEQALEWLQERQEARSGYEPDLLEPGDSSAVDRATAIDPADLNRQQAAVAQWLSRRYRVAPEPISRLVQEAWSLGQRVGLEPTLILAIVAIESSFNPFAQSPVGAQGLMQVLTRVHDDKYEAFGGTHAAFDPLTNLRVGVQVLKDCIAKAGSVEGGLRFYVGAAHLADDGGYAFKVLAEQGFMQQLLRGRSVPVTARLPVPPVPGSPDGRDTSNSSQAREEPEVPARSPDTDKTAPANPGHKPARIALAQ